MAFVSDTALADAVRLLREALPDVRVVYLFGSRAAGGQQTHAESDIDLAVLGARPLPAEAQWALQERLAGCLHASVDLVDLQAASTVMRMQVVSTGRVLYERSRPERDHFETYVYSAYAHLNEERRALLADIRDRGRIYGK